MKSIKFILGFLALSGVLASLSAHAACTPNVENTTSRTTTLTASGVGDAVIGYGMDAA